MEIIMGNRNRLPLGGAPILAALLFLPGCFPLPVSLAMDGISYASSGKSVSDHFLSSIAQKDCSFGRALISQSNICLDDDTDDLTIIVEGLDENQDLDIAPASGDDIDDLGNK